MLDRLLRAAVALWFFMLSTAVAYGLGALLAHDGDVTGLPYARIASRTCLLSFLAMIGIQLGMFGV